MYYDYIVMFEHLFSERGLSLDRLKTLIEVARAGSIAGAARGDSARQSLYSRQIKELEEFFGVELTRRRGKVLVLTRPGWELVRRAHESLCLHRTIRLRKIHIFKNAAQNERSGRRCENRGKGDDRRGRYLRSEGGLDAYRAVS